MNLKQFARQQGSTLIVVIGIALIGAIIGAIVLSTSRTSSRQVGKRRSTITALNIAEAGREHLISSLVTADFTPEANRCSTVYRNVTFGSGRYTVTCSSNAGRDTVWIRSQGMETGGSAKRIEVVAFVENRPPLRANGVRGAVTSRSSVTLKGNVEADGRDYDSTGTIRGPGVVGVSACGNITMQGSADIGGNGLAPARVAPLPPVAEPNLHRDSVPSTLEGWLGMQPGELDHYKVTSLPSPPFHGIYYVEGSVGPLHFGSFSSGVLIIHNSAFSAQLKANTGLFKGLIITDLVDKINGNLTILGGVVTLREGADIEATEFHGAGNAKIRYSSQILQNLHNYTRNLRRRVNVVSWREIPPVTDP